MSAMARGPTGLTTVLTGEMAIRAGAILSPCTHQQTFSRCSNTIDNLCTKACVDMHSSTTSLPLLLLRCASLLL